MLHVLRKIAEGDNYARLYKSASPDALFIESILREFHAAKKTVMDKDMTSFVRTGSIDNESLPLEKCACGREFSGWDFQLGIYREMPKECPQCKRLLYFSVSIHVMQVVDVNEKK